jgi:hypothetical protein
MFSALASHTGGKPLRYESGFIYPDGQQIQIDPPAEEQSEK